MRTIVFYKSEHPDKIIESSNPQDYAGVEFKQVLAQDDNGSWRFKVGQGWWNEAQQKAIIPNFVINRRFESEAEADAAADEQAQILRETGWQYTVAFDPFEPKGFRVDRADHLLGDT